MVDGWETMQIAYRKLCWEEALQHGEGKGKRSNSLQKASLGGSDACRKLSWEEGIRRGKRKENNANSLRRALLGGSTTAW